MPLSFISGQFYKPCYSCQHCYRCGLRIGIHTSKAGAFENAARKAIELGANCFQIFSSSPRTWRCGLPNPDDIKKFKAIRAEHDLKPLVVHSNYLINLAAPEGGTFRDQSIDSFRLELERCLFIGADYVVLHPGSYKGRTCEDGIVSIVENLIAAAHGLKSKTLTILLENTAGAGCHVGSRFEELRAIRELAGKHIGFNIGYCIDTCHCLVSNYDVATDAGLRETVRQLDIALGLENVPVIHSNDSKGKLGSKLDRHANIGEGYIGNDGFRRILNHPKLRQKAFILETPVDKPGDDLRNVEALKQLCRRSRTTTKRSS